MEKVKLIPKHFLKGWKEPNARTLCFSINQFVELGICATLLAPLMLMPGASMLALFNVVFGHYSGLSHYELISDLFSFCPVCL